MRLELGKDLQLLIVFGESKAFGQDFGARLFYYVLSSVVGVLLKKDCSVGVILGGTILEN